MIDSESWNCRKIKTMYETASVMRCDKWTIWAERTKEGTLYYDCHRGHAFLKRCSTAEEARKTCAKDKEEFDAYINEKAGGNYNCR